VQKIYNKNLLVQPLSLQSVEAKHLEGSVIFVVWQVTEVKFSSANRFHSVSILHFISKKAYCKC